MDAAQKILKEQCKGKVIGWQSTLYEQSPSHFSLIQDEEKFVQVMLVGKCHWITVSNVGCDQPGVVNIYDSLNNSVSADTMGQICSFWRSSVGKATFRIMNTLKQTNDYDCGLFAIACATELAFHKDPVKAHWDVQNMRNHLQDCLSNGKLSCFPQMRERRVPSRNRYRNAVTEDLFCICMTPNDRKRPMIQCDNCSLWFHAKCLDVNLDPDANYESEKWFCPTCV